MLFTHGFSDALPFRLAASLCAHTQHDRRCNARTKDGAQVAQRERTTASMALTIITVRLQTSSSVSVLLSATASRLCNRRNPKKRGKA
jgi:hypothetical protein